MTKLLTTASASLGTIVKTNAEAVFTASLRAKALRSMTTDNSLTPRQGAAFDNQYFANVLQTEDAEDADE